MIGERETFHGVVLSRLLYGAPAGSQVNLFMTLSGSAYVVSNSVALYVKYSTNRLTPWPFVFTSESLLELKGLREDWDALFIVLVCGKEGIVCVDWDKALQQIVKPTSQGGFSLQASRKRGQKFRVTGGRVAPILMSDSEFPGAVFRFLSAPSR